MIRYPDPREGIPLRDYVDRLLFEFEKRINQRFDDLEKNLKRAAGDQKDALELARETINTRLAGMNEFRDTLKDQAGTFVTRAELVSTMGSLQESINSLKESRATLEGKASQSSVNIGYVASGLALLIALVSCILKFT